ncbi:uncharacterized protein LOC143367261 [Andrena cerasifolii]|uniref:uncharacterized protein LOC143367261 n=1 Tax=Andrena cerasifolii TaxID=2819439 RepID=UPI004037C1E0
MDKIVNEQSTLFKRISNLKENMMKLGKKKITRGVITSRIDLLESYWTTFSKNDAKINAGATEEIKKSLYFTEDYLSLGEEAYLNQKADLLDQLDALPVRRKADEQSGTDSDETDSSRGRTLQKIALPTFAGDYQLWPSFRDLFISLIIKNSSLSAVDKLHYLKSSLSGEAARVIQNVTITANNFKRAWLAVSEQYDVPRLLIHAQLKALMSLPAMSSASARELKDLLHGTQDAVEALETLHLPVQHWSAWLVYLTAERLDAETRKDWETSLGTSKEHPTFQQLLDFLRTQVRAALASEFSTSGSTSQQPTGPSGQRGRDRQQPPASSGATRRPKTHCVTRNNAGNQKCALCAGEHFILYCPSYQALGPRERKARVTRQTGSTNQGVSPSLNSVTPTTHCAQTQTMGAAMLLATALVRVATVTGEGITVRALIDPCSEVSLIGESIAQLLKLPRTPTNIPVIGVAKCKTYSKGSVTLTVSHRKDKSVNLAVQALVLPRLSSYQPSPAQLSTSMPHLKDLELADPEFLSCRKVDLLLGAEVYSQIILEGLKHGPPRTPVAQATTLGWILTGPITDRGQIARANTAVTLQCSTETDISELLQRFWAIEEVSTPFTSLNEDEKACEEHFAQTHTRDDSGSDRGTNFVGADKELRQWFSTATSELGDLAPLLADMGTKWVFNPPAAPHFGGIWEAAVKSMKFHLRRVIGDTPMTFEEMATLLTQIEACLNSRPLIPLSDEPDDFNFLTPSHFLVGSSLIAVPEPSLAAEPRNRLSRWQFIQQMRDHYWQRWAAEYLQTLQSRNKWVTGHPNVQVGDLCLLRNEAMPPTHWPIGRITAVHPGKDDLVRVVTIRTAYTTLQRPIAKISVFPSASSDSVPTRSMPKQT